MIGVPCQLKGCDGKLVEGGERDRGRYHCNRCMTCQDVPSVWFAGQKIIARLESTLATVTAERDRLREALRPLARAFYGWPYAVIEGKDLGRYNFDTGITAKEVLAAVDCLATAPTGGSSDET
jgi:hypothetical protein